MRKHALVLFASMICGCAGSVSMDETGETGSEIIGGVNDTGDPAVVALFAHQPNASSGELCTATLISPTVLLTAGHCTLPAPGEIVEAFFNPTLSGTSRFAVKEVHSNPAFSESNLNGGHDVGVAILAAPSSVTPLPFNTTPITNANVGQAVRIVGYGLNMGPAQTGSGAGTKREATTVLDDISAQLLHIGNNSKATCSGDSGGPAFMNIGGVQKIVGVTSFGNGACSGGGFDTRVDANLAFINQFVNGGSTPPGNPGTCSHALCSTGGKLVSSCDPCAAKICAVDSFCCANSWDSTCVGEVKSVCNQSC